MSLLDYETAKRYAGVIKFRVQERLMPPWHVDKNVGVQTYKNDVSLSDEQIETIARWVDAGAPRGPGDPPPVPDFPKGGSWQLEAELQRPPDLVVRSSPYDVQPNGQDQWWGPAVPVEGIDEPRWIQAYEFKPSYPGGMKVVHHGHAYYRTADSEQRVGDRPLRGGQALRDLPAGRRHAAAGGAKRSSPGTCTMRPLPRRRRSRATWRRSASGSIPRA